MSIKTGLALFSLRDELQKDYLGTLEKVAEMGYDCVELIGFSSEAMAEMKITNGDIKNKLNELNLKAVSCHVSAGHNMDWDQIISDVYETGAEAVVLPFAHMNSYEEVKALAEMCNQIGKKCDDKGMRFFYHNHFQEFIKINDQFALDLFLELTDPEYVHIELDTFWVQRAGLNPIEQIVKLGSRCKMLHQKDLSSNAFQGSLLEKINVPMMMDGFKKLAEEGSITPTDIVEVGTGVMDIKGICDAAKSTGIECIIVELDQIYNMGPFESVQLSLNNLKKNLR